MDIAISKDSAICTRCFDNVWFQICFRYREAINKNLPPGIRDRAECWYGINCKTALHKEDHSKKLNHICEQVTESYNEILFID